MFENSFNQFLVLENHSVDTKILILGALEEKLGKQPTDYSHGGHLGFWALVPKVRENVHVDIKIL